MLNLNTSATYFAARKYLSILQDEKIGLIVTLEEFAIEFNGFFSGQDCSKLIIYGFCGLQGM